MKIILAFRIEYLLLEFFNIRAFGPAGLRKWNIQAVAVTRSLPLPHLKRNEEGKEWSSFLVSRVRRLSQKKGRKRKKTQNISSSLGISERAQSVVVLGFLLTAQEFKWRKNSRTREKKMWIIKTQFVSFYEECKEMQSIIKFLTIK